MSSNVAMNWSLASISSALQTQLLHAPNVEREVRCVQNVCIDSREVKPGDLFVCLAGERFDAHDFSDQVKQAGAIGLVVSRPVACDLPQWLVKDTRLALGLLARAWREQFDIPVLAVVGSNGKTTSKEMLTAICRAQHGEAHVLSTQGNLNNDIGVPKTLFRLRASHRMAVIEMGMNHPGEMAWLAGLVKPTVVLMTNAQREHQEFMKTVEAVAVENGQAFLALQPSGTAVFPAGTAFESIWQEQAKTHAVSRFGEGGQVYCSALPQGGELMLNTPQGQVVIHPHFMGQHNVLNASAAAAAALAAGCSLPHAKAGLEAFRPVWGRMEVVLNTSELLLINDAYNANPDSVRAAIDVLATYTEPTVLVLGDMGEVGEQSLQFHEEVGRHARHAGLSALLCLGEATEHTTRAYGEGAQHFKDVELLIQTLAAQLGHTKKVVLVKGSRFMKMERVVQAVLALQAQDGSMVGDASRQTQGGSHAA